MDSVGALNVDTAGCLDICCQKLRRATSTSTRLGAQSLTQFINFCPSISAWEDLVAHPSISIAASDPMGIRHAPCLMWRSLHDLAENQLLASSANKHYDTSNASNAASFSAIRTDKKKSEQRLNTGGPHEYSSRAGRPAMRSTRTRLCQLSLSDAKTAAGTADVGMHAWYVASRRLDHSGERVPTRGMLPCPIASACADGISYSMNFL